MVEWNPALKPSGENQQSNKGLAKPAGTCDVVENFVWQTREAAPTEYENALGDALEGIFSEGLEELAEIVGRLNEIGLRTQDGENWTEDAFEAEMKRLGA